MSASASPTVRSSLPSPSVTRRLSSRSRNLKSPTNHPRTTVALLRGEKRAERTRRARITAAGGASMYFRPCEAACLTGNIVRGAMRRVKPERKIPARVSTCRDRRLRSPVQHWDQPETANVNQVIRYHYRCLPPGAFVRFDNLERPSICSIGARSPRTIQSRLCPCWSANAIRFASLPVLSAFITASTSAAGRPSAARIRRNRRRTAFQSTAGIIVGSTMFLSPTLGQRCRQAMRWPN